MHALGQCEFIVLASPPGFNGQTVMLNAALSPAIMKSSLLALLINSSSSCLLMVQSIIEANALCFGHSKKHFGGQHAYVFWSDTLA